LAHANAKSKDPKTRLKIMETQTRYDLNTAIENWRAELAAQPDLTAEVRRELETHLRDAIAGFHQRGLNDEESFWLARRRVGQPPQLGEEFVKADPAKIWRERVFWMATGVFGWWLLGLTIYSLESILGWLIPVWGRLNDQIFVWFDPLQICVIAAIVASGRLIKASRHFQWLFQGRLRVGISAVGLTTIASFLWAEALNQASAWSDIWHLFSINLILASSFVLLLIWLLPPKNQNTPKRA
jgi:hypothetical protein